MKKITFKVKETKFVYVEVIAESVIDAMEKMDEMFEDKEAMDELFSDITDCTHEYEIADNEEV